jgi:hypothetical protein
MKSFSSTHIWGEVGMPELVRFPLADGGWAVAEVDDPTGVVRAARGTESVFTAGTTFDAIMAQIRGVADTTMRGLRDTLSKPDEVEWTADRAAYPAGI